MNTQRLHKEIARAVGEVCGVYSFNHDISLIYDDLAYALCVVLAQHNESFDIVGFCRELKDAYNKYAK